MITLTQSDQDDMRHRANDGVALWSPSDVLALLDRIAALEAQLAERDNHITTLEVAAVKAVLPLEAMNISGVVKRFDEETTLAILDGISSVRAAIRARSEQKEQG